MLDGVADLVFYPCAALLLYQLFPAVVLDNLEFIALAIGILGLMLAVSASFTIDTSSLLRATALLYTLGFIEGIAIFLRHGAVPADTRSLFALSEYPPPSAARAPAVLQAPRSD
jgi:hypothetical protein